MSGSVQLHVHTEHSLLDGFGRNRAMAAKAARDGQTAMAVTDHGTMTGIIEAAKACEAVGIRLIPGIELYQAKKTVDERPATVQRAKKGAAPKAKDGSEEDATVQKKEKTNHHLCAWAMDNEGLRNLYRLSSFAWTNGFYSNPRVDWTAMSQYSAGVMVSTGCLGGQVLQNLMAGDRPGADAALGQLVDIYGRDNVLVELQRHGIPEQDATNPQLVDMAVHFGLRTIACADSHYAEPGDAPLHDCLLCQSTGAKLDTPGRFKFSGSGHHLHTQAEMERRFNWIPEAVTNTLWVADHSNVTFEFGQLHLPKFALPAGWNDASAYLGHLAYQGALVRYGDPVPEHVRERCVYELSVINGMQLADYFLITADIVREARRRDIPVGPGRGSAAGAAIAYCLGITLADPVSNGLIFERFLNPGRANTMPDIDLDFGAERRHEMFTYIEELYGKECVAKIGTLTRMQARTAVKDVAKIMGYPFSLGGEISRVMPPVAMGRSVPITACLELDPAWAEGFAKAADLRNLAEASPMARQVLEVAAQLEGTVKTTGVHASAALITPGPVTNFTPLKVTKNRDTGEKDTVTQFDLHDVEDLGLLKMDFLGLRFLDVIWAAAKMVGARHGVVINPYEIPLDDLHMLEFVGRGETVGVFQLESGPMRTLLRSIRPKSINDISAVIALYRPGPMGSNMHTDYALRHNGIQEAKPFHPDAIPLLGDTHQLMIYQEQVMEVSRKFAGYNLAEADVLRKACGKKIPAVMEAQRGKFIAGCETQGYGTEFGTMLFNMINKFSDYAFNKAHSFCYAIISIWTAYLKAHYGVEFMAASLTSLRSKMDKAMVLLAECRRMKIEMLPPDVNRSAEGFTPEGLRSIRIGLSCIRGIGDPVAQLIMAERSTNGPFRSLSDYTRRMRGRAVSVNIMDALIRAGAFDELTGSRLGAQKMINEIQTYGKRRAKKDDYGQLDMLGAVDFNDEPVIMAIALPRNKRLQWERELMGAWITDHPLAGLEAQIEEARDTQTAEVQDLPDGQKVVLVGTVTGVSTKVTKRGQTMAIVSLEDFSGAIEVVVFPQAYGRNSMLLTVERNLVISGRVQRKEEDDPGNIIADEIEQLNGQSTGPRVEMAIPVPVPYSAPEPLRPVLLVVTGSRHWTPDQAPFIAQGLNEATRGRSVGVVFAGGAKGADTVAIALARQAGFAVHEMLADWDHHGPSAGPLRNTAMIGLALQTAGLNGWDVQGVAFPARDSIGTWDCITKMERHQIPVAKYWWPEPAPLPAPTTMAQIEARAARKAAAAWTDPWCQVTGYKDGKVYGRCGRWGRGPMRDIGFTSSLQEVSCERCIALMAPKKDLARL